MSRTKSKTPKQKALDAARKELVEGDLLTPIRMEDLGSDLDPCFGKHYDLRTEECKACGDQELCCIAMANHLGTTRAELNKKNSYKDIENPVDTDGLRKYYRKLKREGKEKKEIIQSMQTKYHLTKDEARSYYRQFTNKEY